MAAMFRSRLSGYLARISLAVAVFVVTFAIIEGLSSLGLLMYDAFLGSSRALPTHMQPDTLLGWVNKPNLRLANMYGPGVDLSTNSRSFRGSAEYVAAVPAGKLRVICSGDSFTFGVGVGDHATWCARLQALDPALQTVNLGNPGWGVDQAFLFHQVEGTRLQHDIHIFAFIPDDYARLRLGNYMAYPKPLFRINDGELVLTNVPVRKPSRFAVWYSSHRLDQLRVVALATRVLKRVAGRAPRNPAVPDVEAREIMLRLFEELNRRIQLQGGRLIVVLLEEDLTANAQKQWLRGFLARELAQRSIPFVDLWSEFRQMPVERLTSMFDMRWKHYSPEGNEVVAARIYERLRALPEVGSRLSDKGREYAKVGAVAPRPLHEPASAVP